MKLLSIAALFLVCAAGSNVSAQTRVNDKDIEVMMNNLKSDTGRFRSVFNQAIGKTTIRHTSRAKDSKSLVTNFNNQVAGTYQTFKNTRKADAQLPLVIDTAGQINTLLQDVSFGDATDAAWAKVKTELKQLTDAYGVANPM